MNKCKGPVKSNDALWLLHQSLAPQKLSEINSGSQPLAFIKCPSRDSILYTQNANVRSLQQIFSESENATAYLILLVKQDSVKWITRSRHCMCSAFLMARKSHGAYKRFMGNRWAASDSRNILKDAAGSGWARLPTEPPQMGWAGDGHGFSFFNFCLIKQKRT